MITALLLLALTLLLVRRFLLGYPAEPPGLAILNRGEAALVEAAGAVLFPGGAGLPVDGADAHLPHYVDRHLAALPRAKRLQIRALFLLVEHLTLIFPGDGPGGRRRFSSLTVPGRVSVLASLASHPSHVVRTLFAALRALLVLGYLGHPANLRDLGVAPFEIEPGVSDAELLFPRVGALPSSISFGEADRRDPTSLAPLDPQGPRHRAYLRSSRDSR